MAKATPAPAAKEPPPAPAPEPSLDDRVAGLEQALGRIDAARELDHRRRELEGNTVPRGLAAKIARIQLEIEDVPRAGHADVVTQKGAKYSYDYITEADLMKAVRPLLARYGVASFYSDRILGQHETVTTVEVTWTLVDGETNEERILTGQAQASDYGDKAASKAKTTAMRYLLWKTFLQPSDEDPEQDGTGAAAPAASPAGATRTPARGVPAGSDRRPALRSRIAEIANAVDEAAGAIPGSTLGALNEALTLDYELTVDRLNDGQLVAVGLSIDEHLQAVTTAASSGEPIPDWRPPEGLLGDADRKGK